MDDHDDDLPLICPVTGSPCTTEQDEFCEDYGCARKAGIDVDRGLYLSPCAEERSRLRRIVAASNPGAFDHA